MAPRLRWRSSSSTSSRASAPTSPRPSWPSVGQRAVTDLRNALYEHVLNQSFTFLGRHTTGSLMSHITTDVEKIQNAVSEMAGDLLKEGLTVVGPGGRALLHGLAPGPRRPRRHAPRRSIRWCASAAGCAPSNETSLRRWRDISEILQETISGFRVVKAFGMEAFELARFRRATVAPLPREHADHPDHRHPAAAHGGGGRPGPRGRPVLRQPLHPRPGTSPPAPSSPSWPRSSRCTRRSSASPG